ncbi:transmembrane-type terpene cyclase [Nostoc sp.]|uniref:transmembrane-type terpene cyclase n=1 Tax=Nostoc sp. TaxID=1180 RepID=UPI002FF75887
MMNIGTYLLLACGVFWSLTYVLLIKRGFQDKTCGMPLVALCANISWEFIFSFVHPHSPPQLWVNIIWFTLDVIILFQFLYFGQSLFAKKAQKLFYPMFVLTLVTSFCCVFFISYEFNDWSGAYTAFGQNLMMSILFIDMLLRRNTLLGQSIFIALSKMIGTTFASIGFYIANPTRRGSLLLLFLYSAIFVFDLIYIMMVAIKLKQTRNPQVGVIQ